MIFCKEKIVDLFVQSNLILSLLKISSLVLFLWIVFTNFTYSQGQETSKYSIANDSINYREKVFLHLDKSYYNAGEDIWFKVYLLNAASHLWDAIRNVVYVDIVGPDNKIIDFKIIRIEDGIGKALRRLWIGMIRWNRKCYWKGKCPICNFFLRVGTWSMIILIESVSR